MSTTRGPSAVFQPDVVIVGGGLIGLMCAAAVARRGLCPVVITTTEPGAASAASAGILAPSVGRSPEPGRALGIASRDMYPTYLAALTSRTGAHVPLDLSGVLEVAFTIEEAAALQSTLGTGGEWIEPNALKEFEPALAPARGALLYRGDGSIDSVALLNAVSTDAKQDRRISFRDGRVTRVEPGRSGIHVELASGDRLGVGAVVVAAGAWAGAIAGLPRPLPVVPVRGQILAITGVPLRHVIMGPRGYAVSRRDRSLVGSTMEHVGFDARTTSEGAALLHAYAREISPELADRHVLEHWAGLRPVTPDFLPIVGADPDCEGVFYACGHSRNGVLLAPLTATVIAELISAGTTSIDITPYAPSRFDS